jgi:hypothetical protein
LFRAVQPGRGGDLVVAELRERHAVRSVEHVDGALGRDPRHGSQRAVPHDGQHDVAQRLRHVVTRAVQRLPHLGAGVGTCGQLEVPSGVGAAGAPAQRDAVRGEVAVRGVEVDGVELLHGRTLHRRDR